MRIEALYQYVIYKTQKIQPTAKLKIKMSENNPHSEKG